MKSESKSLGYLQELCGLPLPWIAVGKPWVGKVPQHLYQSQQCRRMIKLERCGYNRTDQVQMQIPVWGFQLVAKSWWRPLCSGGESSSQEPEMLWWVSPFFLGIFCLVPLFPTWANLFLGELTHPVEGHQASKETNSRIQTLPNGEQCLVEQTKIREWVGKRAGLR